ncbi:MAG: hypothetical protein ED859_18340 [Desulfuromonadales bacterium]|nr:MAG: hypothetical protein ED859_18340 [Desulfuromonadales bacterium]
MSQHINQLVWQGWRAIASLAAESPVPALTAASQELHALLGAPGRGGPIVAFIATRGEKAASPELVKAMDRLATEAEKLPPTYDQAAFQCLSDYKKAKEEGMHPFLAGFALAICLTERVFKIELG